MAKTPQEATIPAGTAVPAAPAYCKLLEDMRGNPAGDWTIKNVETLCRQLGLTCNPPRGGGSHYKVSSPRLDGIMTIPAKKPVKKAYIKLLVSMCDGHRATGPIPGER